MIHFRILPSLAIFASLLLIGCVSPSATTTSNNTEGKTEAESTQTLTQSSTVEPPPETPFSKSTLYALMVAEIASNREHLDISLGNYLEQAHITQDPGVAERALRIAHYIGARQAALEASKLWAENDPENLDALQAYALEMAQAGHLNDSALMMQRVLQLGGVTHFDLLALRADDLQPYERVTLQSTIAETLVQFPSNPQLRLAQAIMLEHEQNYTEALQQLTELQELFPKDDKAALHRARLLHRLHRNEEAAQNLEAAIQRHPQSPRLHLLYAQVLIALNRFDDALTQFKLLHESAPNDADLILSIALTSLEGNLLDQAELYLNKLLVLKEQTSTAHYYLGRLAEMQDDWQTARDHYLQVTEENDLLPAYTMLSRMLADHERWQEARTHLQQARQDHPDLNTQLYLLEAEILIEQREYAQAQKVLNEAVTANPESIPLLYARAMLAEKSDELTALEQDLRNIIEIDPDNSMALNALGYTLADRTDRYQEAAELIRKAHQITPDDPAIIDSLGWVEFRLGNTDEAIKLLQQAYQLYPDPEIAAHLIEVLWSVDREDEAHKIWQQSLEINPESDLLKAVMERLNPS